ncbi:histamine H2 receptor-like [Montipora capricornis]|uniref:histamine H2 receptor-like n=1 Tax=Montipora capricornis TaxID=246305 RepID=UPI0035F121E6
MEVNHTTNCFFLTTVQLLHEGGILFSEIICCAVNSVLALTAALFNSIVIFVVWKTPLLHTPSNVLISCLAGSDLVIGLVAQPLFVVYKIAELSDDAKIACDGRLIHWIAGFVCAGVSVMTIATIAVDKMLALQLHLRYKQIVTVRRVMTTVLAYWFFCVVASVSLFIANSDRYWTLVPIPVLSISLIATFVAYIKIFNVLRRHRNQIRTQTLSAWDNGNMKKYKKSVFTMVYVLMMFLACYTPFLTAMVFRLILGYNSLNKMAYEWTATVVYLNSSLNPLLYWFRMQEIRVATYNALRKLRGKETESRIDSKIHRINVLNDGFQ